MVDSLNQRPFPLHRHILQLPMPLRRGPYHILTTRLCLSCLGRSTEELVQTILYPVDIRKVAIVRFCRFAFRERHGGGLERVWELNAEEGIE